MEILAVIRGIVLGFVILLGWIPLLIIGIVRIRRRKKKPSGIVMTVIGGVWVLCLLSITVVVFHSYSQLMKYTEVEDFDPEQCEEAVGSIVLPYKGKSTLVLRDNKNVKGMRLRTEDGVMVVPEGTYDLEKYQLVKEDESGVEWVASGYLYSLGEISVEAGSSRELEIGSPFTAKVLVREKKSGEAVFDLKLTGRSGVEYTIARVGKGSKAPGFQVVDESGNVLWHGKFEYG